MADAGRPPGLVRRPSRAAEDLRLLDACWRGASRSEPFAEDFEAERHGRPRRVEDARQAHSRRGRGGAEGDGAF
jgi:hypothetical protein